MLRTKLQGGRQCLDVVFEVMEHHSTNVDVQEHVLYMLYLLAFNDSPIRHQMVARGVVPAILATLKNFPSSVDVQQHGCLSLHVLMSNNTEAKHAVAEAGGVAVISQAMDNHVMNADVQTAALLALLSLSVKPQHRQLIREANGIERVMTSMQEHASVSAIQQHGCWFLENLSLDAEGRDAMLSDGVVDFLRVLLSKHRDYNSTESETIRRRAALALRHFERGFGGPDTVLTCAGLMQQCTVS
eukprot:m.230222 g.230222  ORF g.230222 m.230222 type:complete len:243 (+) comp18858_c1_seq1:2081-2809(+)